MVVVNTCNRLVSGGITLETTSLESTLKCSKETRSSSSVSRLRSVEETEVAHELLQLAMSGPPLTSLSSQQCRTYIIFSSSGTERKMNTKEDRYITKQTESTAPRSVQISSKSHVNICGTCGKCYATASNLARHKQTHRSLTSSSARECNTCGKRYVSMPALSMHLLTHQQQHRCPHCGKLFSRPWLLRGHMRSHTGERPYVCRVCSKRFADRSNLRAHVQTHSSSKSYSCPLCHKLFALKSYLTKHCESVCRHRVR